MKCIFSLVVLLHLCNTIASDFNVNKEIMTSLKELNKLYKDNQISISSPVTVKVPSLKMCNHAATCVEVFKRELQTLLRDRVVVHNDMDGNTTDTLEKLEENLDFLQQDNQTVLHCNMIDNHKPSKIFNDYAYFLQKLNNNSIQQDK